MDGNLGVRVPRHRNRNRHKSKIEINRCSLMNETVRTMAPFAFGVLAACWERLASQLVTHVVSFWELTGKCEAQESASGSERS